MQNLFYLNNLIHDTLYRAGFTEAAGNFQLDNLSRGGKDSDPVQAEAQDGGGTDNANFATPTDGHDPRMQMYLWVPFGPFGVVVHPTRDRRELPGVGRGLRRDVGHRGGHRRRGSCR